MMLDESLKETAMPPYHWQSDLWSEFCGKVNAERLPHALLLSGIEGVGVTALANSMARYLLCQAPLEDVACGRCRGCQLFVAASHPDLYVLKREDGATQIKVDQVRSCVEFVAKTSHFQRYKVVVVDGAEAMNNNAANALLKSLEEPAGQTVFILVTNRASSILPTIRSRCQKMLVNVPSQADSLAWLEQHNVSSAGAWLDQAGGAPILARYWAEGDFAEQQDTVYKAAQALIEGTVGAQSVALEWQKVAIERLINIQLFALESILKSKIGSRSINSALEALSERLEGLDDTLLFRLREKLNSKLSLWRANPNLNAVMLCEEMAMDWHTIAQLAKRARYT